MPEDCEDDTQPGLTIAVNRPEITRAYLMRTGVEYVFAIGITNHSYALLEVRRFKCSFPLRTQFIGPKDPQFHTPQSQAYRLPSGRKFPCERVLNHRTGRFGSINTGDTIEGLLLAFRMGRVLPNDYLAGSSMTADLSIVDQFGREHVSEIEIKVDRTGIIDLLKLIRPSGPGLFGPCEPHTNPAFRKNGLYETEPPSFLPKEPWWNCGGEAPRRHEHSDTNPDARKDRTGKFTPPI